MIAIVTETLCCMSKADCAAHGITLQPLSCRVGQTIKKDRIITAEQELPDGDGESIPPSEEEYRTRFTELLHTHDGVICITVSRKFSESNRRATLAAAAFGGRVLVIDSGTVAGGLFLLAVRARHMVTLGYPMSRIKAELESYKHNLRVTFTSRDVGVLQAARRLSGPIAREPDSALAHPVFHIADGSIGLYGFAEGDRETVRAMLSAFSASYGASHTTPSHIVVHFANRTLVVDHLISCIRDLYPLATVYERRITLAIQLNLGRDIVGLIGD